MAYEYTTLATSHLTGWDDELLSTMDGVTREVVLFNACEFIENNLSSREFLSRYTIDGMQAFINDEEKSDGYHFVDLFYVEFDGMKYHICNGDIASSKNGKHYYLFELLYNGVNAYSVPVERLSHLRARIGEEGYAYRTRTKKQKADLMQMFYPEGRMTYYYKYAGRWVYKAKTRGPTRPEVTNKFKQYLDDAIKDGISQSVRRHVGDAYEFGEA